MLFLHTIAEQICLLYTENMPPVCLQRCGTAMLKALLMAQQDKAVNPGR
jgi:hypothetical protein